MITIVFYVVSPLMDHSARASIRSSY